MNKDEALKMAIEALETLMMEKGSIYQQALQACKEALAQPSNMVNVPLDKLQDMQRRLKVLAQPQKQWVGLSDEEIFVLCPYIDHDLLEEAFYRGAKATEAKLKELNYG